MNENNSSNTSRTNWDRVDAMSDDQIDTSDAPALGPTFFSRATERAPVTSVHTALPVDADVLTWFKALGPQWERRFNAALRIYMDAHREPGPIAPAGTRTQTSLAAASSPGADRP